MEHILYIFIKGLLGLAGGSFVAEIVYEIIKLFREPPGEFPYRKFYFLTSAFLICLITFFYIHPDYISRVGKYFRNEGAGPQVGPPPAAPVGVTPQPNPPQSVFAGKPTCETAIDKAEIPVSISATGPSGISSEDIERSLEAQVPLPFRVVSQPECSVLSITALTKLSTKQQSINGQTGTYVSATTDITFFMPKTQQEKRVSSTYSESFIDQNYKDFPDWPERCVASQSIHKALLGFDSIRFLSSTFRVKITGLAPAEDSTSQCAAG